LPSRPDHQIEFLENLSGPPQSDRDFENSNRNRDRDQKSFRKNRSPIFVSQPDPDFHKKIDQRF